MKEHKGWYMRRLPHLDAGKIAQFVTFRLADSLPQEKLRRIEEERKTASEEQWLIQKTRILEEWLDRGTGECWLRLPSIARIAQDALFHFEGQRYEIHAWVIMPNHVHVLFTPRQEYLLPDILHSWKSYSARRANQELNRTGSFWQHESFDRFIRNQRHFERAIEYIEENPVIAGLCTSKEEWIFGSAWGRKHPACDA